MALIIIDTASSGEDNLNGLTFQDIFEPTTPYYGDKQHPIVVDEDIGEELEGAKPENDLSTAIGAVKDLILAGSETLGGDKRNFDLVCWTFLRLDLGLADTVLVLGTLKALFAYQAVDIIAYLHYSLIKCTCRTINANMPRLSKTLESLCIVAIINLA